MRAEPIAQRAQEQGQNDRRRADGDRPAVDAAMAQVRAELGPIEIIVTSAGFDKFESFTDISDGEGFMRSLPISRFAMSSEVSHLVVYLASDESSYCTGSEFVVDGGMLSGPGY